VEPGGRRNVIEVYFRGKSDTPGNPGGTDGKLYTFILSDATRRRPVPFRQGLPSNLEKLEGYARIAPFVKLVTLTCPVELPVKGGRNCGGNIVYSLEET
jgi:hypothetical protein